MRLIEAALLGLLVTGCSAPSALVINGVSKHLVKEGADSLNQGLGVRFDSLEVGYYDNSRIKPSTSYYATKRMIDRNYYADLGLAYYDSRSGYDASVKPIVGAGFRVGALEVGGVLPDILMGKVVLDF